jgi:hypothetical protein
MAAHDDEAQAAERTSRDNVVALRPRQHHCRPPAREPTDFVMARFPVDIRGQVTFGRLVSGLATVGLTVRVDARSGRVVITDDAWE